MYPFAAVARQLAAKRCESAKRLVVRVALELQHHRFVTKAFQLLEDQQPYHQSYGLGGPSQSLTIMFSKGLIQLRPKNHAGSGATDHWDRVVAAGQCRINWSDELYWKKSTFFILSTGKYEPILTLLVEKVSLQMDINYIFQLGKVVFRANLLKLNV